MIYDVQITAQAESDLRSIFEYIAYELQSVQNAIGQLERLEQSISSLDQMPERFRAYLNEPWNGRGLRVMPVDHYLVFYIPSHESKTVHIVRVLYGGRYIEQQLNRFTQF